MLTISQKRYTHGHQH